jgi:hypothetical protein
MWAKKCALEASLSSAKVHMQIHGRTWTGASGWQWAAGCRIDLRVDLADEIRVSHAGAIVATGGQEQE